MELELNYKKLIDHIKKQRDKRIIIAVEGFMGSGKTYLSNEISEKTNAILINIDSFIELRGKNHSYISRISFKKLKEKIKSNTYLNRVIIIEGVCLRKILQKINVNPYVYIYVKKLSSNGLWHDGLNLEEFIVGQGYEGNWVENHLSDYMYHKKYKPHIKAKIIYERVE